MDQIKAMQKAAAATIHDNINGKAPAILNNETSSSFVVLNKTLKPTVSDTEAEHCISFL